MGGFLVYSFLISTTYVHIQRQTQEMEKNYVTVEMAMGVVWSMRARLLLKLDANSVHSSADKISHSTAVTSPSSHIAHTQLASIEKRIGRRCYKSVQGVGNPGPGSSQHILYGAQISTPWGMRDNKSIARCGDSPVTASFSLSFLPPTIPIRTTLSSPWR